MSDLHSGGRLNLVGAARPYFGAIVLTVIFLAAAGVYSLLGMPSGIYPEVAFPQIAVIATAPGLAVKTTEVSVTRPLEEAVSVVLGVVRVHSKTVRGASELKIDFAPDVDMVQALNDVRARLAESGGALPAGTQLLVERQTPSLFPIISVVVQGDRSLAALRDYAFYDLRPRFSRIPDVSMVTVQGGDVREIIVETDPLALAAAHLSADDVAVELAKNQRLQAVGRLDRGVLQYQVMADTLTASLPTLEATVVGGTAEQPLQLRDVARVSIGHEDRLVAVRSDQRDAVVVTIFRRLGGDALSISRHLEDVLAEARGAAPRGMELTTVYDQADLTKTSIANVRDAILIGGVFSVLTLLLFLRSLRATIIAAAAIPTTLIISFVFLRWWGDTLNLMSLGGLAIAIGLLIDDTVVVIENIARHLQTAAGSDAAIDAASREISGAVVGSTLTTVLVFVPLSFVEGVVGQFFFSLSLSLSVAILVSMVISLTVVPVVAARWLSGRRLKPPGRVYGVMVGAYDWLLGIGLRWPRTSLAVALLVVVPGYWMFTQLKTDFMPEMDEGAFVLDYFMPVGTSLAETDRVMREVDAILSDTPEVQGYVRRTGAELGLFATEPYTGDVLISLKTDRTRRMGEIREEVEERVKAAVPQLEIETVPLVLDQINDLSGAESSVEVKVFGPDYETLRRVAQEVGDRIEALAAEDDVSMEVDAHVRQGNPDIVVRTDSDRARRAGLSPDMVERQVAAALYGTVAFSLPEEDRLTAVRVRLPDRYRNDEHALPNLVLQIPPVATPVAGATPSTPTTVPLTTVPLRDVAAIERQRSLNELHRENQQPMIDVTAEFEGSDLGTIKRIVQRAIDGVTIPKSYHIQMSGSFESQDRAFHSLLIVLCTASALVFLLLAIQFKSIALPLLVFMTQPLSLTAALFALWITGTPLNVSSFMGAIMLIGLDVKNGILLIEYVGQLRGQGTPLDAALREAGRARFRPILMTSLTTILGLSPLALGIGPGAQMQQPLAIAVIGGLTANMLFTRLVIPIGYGLIARWVDRHPAPADLGVATVSAT
ncbi:MAG: efflux RND transporter permease subunit [Pirellulales bacterium]